MGKIVEAGAGPDVRKWRKSGLSYRKIMDRLEESYDMEISHMSVKNYLENNEPSSNKDGLKQKVSKLKDKNRQLKEKKILKEINDNSLVNSIKEYNIRTWETNKISINNLVGKLEGTKDGKKLIKTKDNSEDLIKNIYENRGYSVKNIEPNKISIEDIYNLPTKVYRYLNKVSDYIPAEMFGCGVPDLLCFKYTGGNFRDLVFVEVKSHSGNNTGGLNTNQIKWIGKFSNLPVKMTIIEYE